MPRFVLAYFGKGPMPEADVAVIRRLPQVVVTDASSPNVMVVEGSARTLRVVARMKDWVVGPETELDVTLPGPIA